MRGGHRKDQRQELNAGLSLKAADAEDLKIIATVLQDAVIALTDMKYMAADRLFVMLVNRFRWEEGKDSERINCGVAFEGVEAVQVRGMDLADRSQYLELLTVREDEGGVRLVFAGGAEVRIEAETLACHIRDLGEPWPAAARPHHPIDEPD
ncbi:MAG: DUF2948 family protein [Alphaproteobacteria bacterium]